MEQRGLLERIYTGYPRFKLADEQGVPADKIQPFPWLQGPYMARGKFGLTGWSWLNRQWEWQANNTLDHYVARQIKAPTHLVALSGSGLHAGAAAQRAGGHYICDRGSSHIRFQNEILREEYARWNVPFTGIDPRVIAKEEAEYEQADKITVPSEFVRQSFLKMGVAADKLVKLPYGARLERFQKLAEPPTDRFRVLWVGSIGMRKGFLDVLDAFRLLKHPGKELVVVGGIDPEVKALLGAYNLTGVTFKGLVPNAELPLIYSSAHAFVLPSIEEGLALVQGEALACGCPIIATTHTGCEDLFSDGVEGFFVPIRSPDAIYNRLQQLADDPALRMQMSYAATQRVKALGGWDTYGKGFANLLATLGG